MGIEGEFERDFFDTFGYYAHSDFRIPVRSTAKPEIFDTTLREGFQTPGGIGASLEERIYAASLISRYCDWIELGMPANNTDYPKIKAIKEKFNEEGYDAGIAVLARCVPLDIERAAEVMHDYPKSLIHLFIGTSEEHRSVRFGGAKTDEDYIKMIERSVADAASRAEFSRVMFSPEDAYRTFKEDRETFARFLMAAIRGYKKGNAVAGRKDPLIANLPDTVGYSTIMEFDEMIEYAHELFGGNIELSVHHHNDSGMADAATIHSYQKHRVPFLQTTFAGLGERNGMGSTERVIKTLNERGMLKDSRISKPENLSELDKAAEAILWILGRQVPEEYLRRINITTSGVHSAAVIKSSRTYHIFGERYGSELYVELGPTSGSKQVMEVLSSHGISYDAKRIEEFADKLKEEANKRKSPLSITHIIYEAGKYFNGNEDDGLIVRDYRVQTTDDGITFLKIMGTIDGEPFKLEQKANGPVEASIEALNDVIKKHTGTDEGITLEDYGLRVIPNIGREYLNWKKGAKPRIPEKIGEDAHLAVKVVLRNGDGRIYEGWARHENSTKAEVDAVIDAMSKMYALHKWNGKHS